jgi:general control protein GCN4
MVDPEDKVALKRARNTLAARDSRQRKFDHVQSLERTITELQSNNEELKSEAEKWKSIAMALGFSEP